MKSLTSGKNASCSFIPLRCVTSFFVKRATAAAANVSVAASVYKNLCRCFGAPVRRVFPDHLITCSSTYFTYLQGGIPRGWLLFAGCLRQDFDSTSGIAHLRGDVSVS